MTGKDFDRKSIGVYTDASFQSGPKKRNQAGKVVVMMDHDSRNRDEID